MEKTTAEMLTVFAAEYPEKLFYFSLKKTGDVREAEDLASEIAECVLAALKRGTAPAKFPAWVWKIAHNRYSRWAEKKHCRSEREAFTGEAFFDDEPAAEETAEADVLHTEELTLMRRELAFASEAYRKILVAYYFEDRSVREIASLLGLPEGTVTTRLHRARKNLKEGMGMSREFGVRSYRPENVSFAASGEQPSGLPWKAVQRRIPKNILLAADNNPMTVEELAVELGVASPYMEEEADLLVKATLLRKEKDRYVTNFFIEDAECQQKQYEALRRSSDSRSVVADRIADDLIPAVRKFAAVPENMSGGELKWWLLFRLLDVAIERVYGSAMQLDARENGESWGFVGYEITKLPEYCVSGDNGNGDAAGNILFRTYKIGDWGLWDRAGEMNYAEVILTANMLRSGRRYDDLGEMEKEVLKGIDGRFAHLDADGRLCADIPVFTKAGLEGLEQAVEAHPDFGLLTADIAAAFGEVKDILSGIRTKALHRNLPYYAAMRLFDIRMMTARAEVKAGRLTVPSDPAHSRIAMCLVIGE